MARYIGIAAYSGVPTPEAHRKAVEFVEELARRCPNSVLVLGGYRGLMKIVVDEALRRGLRVVLVIPRDYEDDAYPEEAIVIRTGMDPKGRSAVLVHASDVLVCLGGASGTLAEVVMAYGLGKPVIVLTGTHLPSNGLRRGYPDGVLDERLGLKLTYVEGGVEAARLACEAGGTS